MPYVITNNYTNLKLTITSKVTNLRLNTYINDSDTVFETYSPTSTYLGDGYSLVFTIPTNEYSIGDIITKFELYTNASIHLWQSNEGVKWLIDGEEYSEINNGKVVDTFHSNTKTFKFNEKGTHMIEAVFVGNDALQMASTGKTPLTVNQPPIDEEGSLDNNGNYEVIFVTKNIPTMSYKDGSVVEFQLLKGNVPVPDRTIEIVTPTELVSSRETDKNGKAKFVNNRFKAGKYKLSAYYMDETTNKRVATSSTKTITIEKGQPVFTDNYESAGNFIPKSKYKVVLKFNGTPLANTKITLYIDGKVTTQTTDRKGAVYYELKSIKTYQMKAVFKGNNNMKKAELSRNITVVKPNG